MSLRIGITGNIGAGKTTVCREFERLGVPVYYADLQARRLMEEQEDLRVALSAAFGPEVYTGDGKLNRSWLAARVFDDPPALERLNEAVHPAVEADALRWQAEQRAPYTLHEAAILFEIGAATRYAATIVVACPYAVRSRRVRQRDGTTEAQFAARAARQWTDERKEAAADHLISNHGRALVLPQVLRVHRELLASAHHT